MNIDRKKDDERPPLSEHAPRGSRTPSEDARWLALRLMPLDELLRRLVGGSEHDHAALAHALRLTGMAQRAALLAHPRGLQVAMAVELAQRSEALQRQKERRLYGPQDVATLFQGPLHALARLAATSTIVDEPDPTFVIGLDVRLRLAVLEPVPLNPQGAPSTSAMLGAILRAGCRRLIVVRQVPWPVAVTPRDVELMVALQQAAQQVEAHVLDGVWLGEDGWLSMRRLGFLTSAEPRYQ
jgi:hypothetical protein